MNGVNIIMNHGNLNLNNIQATNPAASSTPIMRRQSYTLQSSPNSNLNHNRKRPHSDMTCGGLAMATINGGSVNSTTAHLINQQLSSSITLPIGSRMDESAMMSSVHVLKSSASTPSVGGSPTSTTAAIPCATLPSVVSSGAVDVGVGLPTRLDNKKMISSPQEFFTSMLKGRGYPGTTFCSLKCGYHNNPTKHQTTSYGVSLTKAIRSSDAITARALLASGLHPNACNKFGESIVHAACRRGDSPMLRALLDAGSSVQVTDDFGRTPLHDACWTSSPNFDTIRLLLDRDPWLLCIMDCRGSTPLGYVRKAHWAVWIGFLGAIADRYWPLLDGITDELQSGERHDAPPLAFMEPNSQPVKDPDMGLKLEVVGLLANGKLSPQDLQNEDSTSYLEPTKSLQQENTNIPPSTTVTGGVNGVPMPLSRITLDPLRQNGSNATTMMKGGLSTSHVHMKNSSDDSSSGPNTILQGFVQVSATTQQVLDCTL